MGFSMTLDSLSLDKNTGIATAKVPSLLQALLACRCRPAAPAARCSGWRAAMLGSN
ncbi:hypothetical protein D3C78_1901990 [compost metagenome]